MRHSFLLLLWPENVDFQDSQGIFGKQAFIRGQFCLHILYQNWFQKNYLKFKNAHDNPGNILDILNSQ